MCGRFVQYADPDLYAEQFDLGRVCATAPHYNVAPTQDLLVVRQCGDGIRELIQLRWGLVPAWSNGPDPRYSMINARAETVSSKPAYPSAFRHRRCLIPSEGFYEWSTNPTGKQPYLVRRGDSPLPPTYAMAGLWETWQGPTGPLHTCAIIVVDANPEIAAVHDRMPAIIEPTDYVNWLDSRATDLGTLTKLLRPAAGPWTLRQVSCRVNSTRNDNAELNTAGAGVCHGESVLTRLRLEGRRTVPRVVGHAQVVEDQADVARQALDGRGDGIAGLDLMAPMAKRRSAVMFSGPCSVRIVPRSSSQFQSRM
jgi:putative SOS response-associated peptidase YedK